MVRILGSNLNGCQLLLFSQLRGLLVEILINIATWEKSIFYYP